MNLIPASVCNLCIESYFIKITSRSRIIYWIIILIIASAIALLPFIFIDISVQARGYFQSEMERQIIYTPNQGKVVHANLRIGTRLKKGDTLLIMDSETLNALHSSIIQRITDNNESIEDLEVLTSFNSNRSGQLTNFRYKAEFEDLKSRQNIQEQVYSKKKSEHERNKILFSQKIIPESDYENSLFIVNSEKDNLNQILVSQISVWQSDLVLRRNERVILLAELEQCNEALANRVIISPSDGEIIQSSDIQEGSIVSAGQNVAEISPGGELIASCFVTPDNIGLLHLGQQVRIQVDALNYNEWGLLEGVIVEISDDLIIKDGSSAYFRIKCKPEKKYLKLKSGYVADIKKGMSLNARIFVIRRSLFNLLFDKASRWFNPYTYAKE